jgi:hypothetical protein
MLHACVQKIRCDEESENFGKIFGIYTVPKSWHAICAGLVMSGQLRCLDYRAKMLGVELGTKIT